MTSQHPHTTAGSAPSQSDGAHDLSPAGGLRREAMLDELLGALQQVHRRRRMRKRIALCLLPIVLAAAATFSVLRALSPASPRRIVENNPLPAAPEIAAQPQQPAAIIIVVRTADARSRSAADITIVDDDQLLDALAEMNRPTGLVRAGDKVWLTSAVTDDANGGSM